MNEKLNKIHNSVEYVVNEVINTIVKRDVSNNVLYVSEVSACLRKAYFSRIYGYKLNYNMLAGSGFHKAVLPLMADILSCEYEVKCGYMYRGIKIVGTADIVCKDYVIEVKLSKSPLPKIEYELQGNAYAYILGKNVYVIVVISDSTGIYVREVNNELWNKFLNRVNELYNALDINKPPKDDLKFKCDTCEFKRECRKLSKLI